MAASIKPTKRTVVPVLMHLSGYAADKLIPSDPVTKMVDANVAFKIVLGDDTGKTAFQAILVKLKSKSLESTPLEEEAIDLSKFSNGALGGQ